MTREEALRQLHMERTAILKTLRFTAEGQLTDKLRAAYEVCPVWGPGKTRVYWMVRHRGVPLPSGLFQDRQAAVDSLQAAIAAE